MREDLHFRAGRHTDDPNYPFHPDDQDKHRLVCRRSLTNQQWAHFPNNNDGRAEPPSLELKTRCLVNYERRILTRNNHEQTKKSLESRGSLGFPDLLMRVAGLAAA